MSTIRSILTAGLLFAPTIPSAALAQTVDFEDLAEGFYGSTFEHAGMFFQDINQVSGVFPSGETFGPQEFDEVIIEDATLFYNDFPGWGSPDKALTFGSAFVPGDNLSIGRISSATIVLDEDTEAVTMDIAYYENGPWGGIVFHLDAIRTGEVVASSETITISDLGGRDNIALGTLTISGVTFDELHLYATFGDEFSLPRILIDDITFGGEACAADFDGDGSLTIFDFLAFQNAFDAGEATADFDGDGSLTIFDFLAFQNAFDAGCP